MEDYASYSLQAGKLIPRGPGARECLDHSRDHAPTPDLVRQFHGTTRPAPGQQRVFHSFAGDSPVAKEMRHGIKTKESLVVRQSLEILLLCKFSFFNLITSVTDWSIVMSYHGDQCKGSIAMSQP